MARKDLSRTVIEGGRYYGNSYFRRASHGIERATTREWLDRIAGDRQTTHIACAIAERRSSPIAR